MYTHIQQLCPDSRQQTAQHSSVGSVSRTRQWNRAMAVGAGIENARITIAPSHCGHNAIFSIIIELPEGQKTIDVTAIVSHEVEYDGVVFELRLAAPLNVAGREKEVCLHRGIDV